MFAARLIAGIALLSLTFARAVPDTHRLELRAALGVMSSMGTVNTLVGSIVNGFASSNNGADFNSLVPRFKAAIQAVDSATASLESSAKRDLSLADIADHALAKRDAVGVKVGPNGEKDYIRTRDAPAQAVARDSSGAEDIAAIGNDISEIVGALVDIFNAIVAADEASRPSGALYALFQQLIEAFETFFQQVAIAIPELADAVANAIGILKSLVPS
ncbi:hypothetical protein Q5752_003114 [Cryptotrichosporon argae]